MSIVVVEATPITPDIKSSSVITSLTVLGAVPLA
jgi:hypothetical protein